MDVLITDASALRRITPVLLGTYLSLQGWVRQRPGRTASWSGHWKRVRGSRNS